MVGVERGGGGELHALIVINSYSDVSYLHIALFIIGGLYHILQIPDS